MFLKFRNTYFNLKNYTLKDMAEPQLKEKRKKENMVEISILEV